MIIGSIDVGYRDASTIVDQPQRYFSAGTSMAGVVTTLDFGIVKQTIPVTLTAVSTSIKNSLKTYLFDTIKPYGTVSVTPDTSDDLQIGATGATNLTFTGYFNAQYLAPNLWRIDVSFIYLGTDTTV